MVICMGRIRSSSFAKMEPKSSSELESMSVEQLSEWLEHNGIPEEFCKKFEDNYIDGVEFVSLTLPEIREMVPPIGLAKKIVKLIPKGDIDAPLVSPNAVAASGLRHPSLSPGPASPLSPISRREGSISSISTATSSDKIQIPDYWREDTQDCIDAGVLDDSSRSDIVRTLVTLLVAKFGPRPGRARCEELGRQLILKYPFMRDDLGTGYASWVAKMIECIENRVKQAKRKMKGGASPNPKRQRVPKDELIHRYPVRVQDSISEDPRSVTEHNKALHEEMKKAKPRDTLMLPLMKNTYRDRRTFIQNDASTVAEILEHYPALVRPAVVEQEMGLIVGDKDIRGLFEKAWTSSYVPALLQYGERSRKKSIQDIYAKLSESDDASRQATAMAILVACMKCTSSEKDTNPLCYLYQEYKCTETPEQVASEPPTRNSPRIAAFVGEETKQYFVIVEQKVLCQVPSFQLALFISFSAHYVFHLQYPKPIKNVMFFLQDYVLAIPDSLRRPATYLATASDIKKLATTH